MKKLFCAIISMVAVFALTACSTGVLPEKFPETTVESEVAPVDNDAGITLKIGDNKAVISPNGDFDEIMTTLGLDGYDIFDLDTCQTAGYDCDDFEIQIDKYPDDSGNFLINSLFIYWGESRDNGIEVAGIRQNFTADDVIAIYGECDEIDSPDGKTISYYWGDVTVGGKSCSLMVDVDGYVKCLSIFYN